MGALIFECLVRSVKKDVMSEIHETFAAYVLIKYFDCSWVYQIHCNVIFIGIWDRWHMTFEFLKSALKIIFWMEYSCSIYLWCLTGTLECWNPWKTWILGPPFHYSRHSSTTSDTQEIPVWNGSKPPGPTCSDLSHQPLSISSRLYRRKLSMYRYCLL